MLFIIRNISEIVRVSIVYAYLMESHVIRYATICKANVTVTRFA